MACLRHFLKFLKTDSSPSYLTMTLVGTLRPVLPFPMPSTIGEWMFIFSMAQSIMKAAEGPPTHSCSCKTKRFWTTECWLIWVISHKYLIALGITFALSLNNNSTSHILNIRLSCWDTRQKRILALCLPRNHHSTITLQRACWYYFSAIVKCPAGPF